MSLDSPGFNAKTFDDLIWEAETALGPLAATGRLMKKDISYGRFGPRDFQKLLDIARQITASVILRTKQRIH